MKGARLSGRLRALLQYGSSSYFTEIDSFNDCFRYSVF